MNFEHTLDWFPACLSSSVRLMTSSAAPYHERRNPIVVYLMSCTQQVCGARDVCQGKNGFLRSIVQLMLLQHGYCTFVTILFRPFARLFVTLAMRIRALFSKLASLFRTCRTSILEDAIFSQNGVVQVPFEVILARQSRHFPTWASASRTSGSRCISHTLLRRRSRRKIRLCRFCTLIHIVSETGIVSFRTLPVRFPLPTIS